MTQKLFSEAQQILVLDAPPQMAEIAPIEVIDSSTMDLPSEVSEPIEIELVVGELPGAPDGLPEIVEVSDDDKEDEKKEDENEAKSKKPEKWDWSSRGATGFVAWVKERFDDVPKHSGMDTAGLSRAQSYLEKLDDEISKAMRMDLDGDLDANKVEDIRAKIEDGIEKLQDRIEKLKKNKKNKRRTKRAEFFLDEETGLVKEAQKITGVKGVMITVPLLISRVARTCISGTISGGKDIEDLYQQQVKKLKLNEREQLEVRALIEDMGFPLRQDWALFPNDEFDPAADETRESAPIYKA